MIDERGPKPGSKGDRPDETRPDENDSNEASFLDRVGTSASGLIQTFSGHSAPTIIASDLAALHASTSKGESSSSSSAEAIVVPGRASAVVRTRESRSHILEDSGPFRTKSIHNTSTGQEAFDHWSTSTVNLPDSNLMPNDVLENSVERLETHTGKARAGSNPQKVSTRQYGEVFDSDGAAVTSLLSQPGFEMNTEPLETWNLLSQDQAPSTESNWLIDQSDAEVSSTSTSTFIEQTRRFVRTKSGNVNVQDKLMAQAEAPKATETSQGNSLEPARLRNFDKNESTNTYRLIPNFRTAAPEKPRNNMGKSRFDEIEREALMADEYVKPWLAVLDKYQDEVWGDMLPLVHEAREEVKKAREKKDEQLKNLHIGPAIRRLKMVLQHINTS